MAALHISISAEKIAQIGPLPITNSMLTSVIVSALIVLFCFYVNSKLNAKGKPGRLQVFAEMIVGMLYGLALDITGSAKKAREFAPIVVSFFIFIIMNNWLGLVPGVGTIGFREGHELEAKLPAIVQTVQARTPVEPAKAQESTEVEEGVTGGVGEEVVGEATSEEKEEAVFVPYLRAGTADLNTTLALALISVALTQFYGFRHLGLGYLKKYINFKNPILFFVGLLETVLEFAKIMSFAFRLFGNIFAGEVLLAVMMFLVPVVLPMPFYGLELFVGFIQALVFSMLSLVFFNLATLGHEEEH